MHMRSDGIQGRQVFASSFALALLQRKYLLLKIHLIHYADFNQFFLRKQTFCAFVLGSKYRRELFKSSF